MAHAVARAGKRHRKQSIEQASCRSAAIHCPAGPLQRRISPLARLQRNRAAARFPQSKQAHAIMRFVFRHSLPDRGAPYATPTKRDDTHGRSHYLREGVVTPQFPALPPSREYDPELDFLCRTAAWISATRGDAPLSFTALLIGFLFGEDPVSGWFQAFVTIQNIDRRKLLDDCNLPRQIPLMKRFSSSSKQSRRSAERAEYHWLFFHARLLRVGHCLCDQMMIRRQIAHRVRIGGIARQKIGLTAASAEIARLFRTTSARLLHP
jgi:hypothetical protein